MREPSSLEAKWAWWEAAVAGLNPPRYEMEPQVGYYAVRRWRGLPFFLPARIWLSPSVVDFETGELVDDEWIFAEIDGERKNPFKVWTWLRPISEEDYQWLKAMRPLQPSKPPLPKQPKQQKTQPSRR